MASDPRGPAPPTRAGQATGYVLAGGRSTRMGRDKATLPWGGGTLLSHALDRLRRACGAVAIACGPTPRYEDAGAPLVLDALAEAGPLGGLVAVLAHAPTPLALVLAVDLPFATPELLRYLVDSAGDDDAVVPVTGDGPHPLCAVYRTSCLSPARKRLAAGEYKMTSFWPEVRVREVGARALTPFGDPAALLANLNSAKDYEAAARERP